MTPPIDDPEALRRILANTEALLLDFDGPICSVFSGFPAPIVADQLRGILAEGGHTTLPEPIQTATDPFDILFYAATLGPNEARYVEAAFRAHEAEAIRTAAPTPFAHQLIRVWKETRRALAVVSNNSVVAVEIYLRRFDLTTSVDSIAARTSGDVSILKPSPRLVTLAVQSVGREASRGLLIGDSVTDALAATAAGVPSVGYVNKPWKFEQFEKVNCVAVVSSMQLIVEAVDGREL